MIMMSNTGQRRPSGPANLGRKNQVLCTSLSSILRMFIVLMYTSHFVLQMIFKIWPLYMWQYCIFVSITFHFPFRILTSLKMLKAVLYACTGIYIHMLDIYTHTLVSSVCMCPHTYSITKAGWTCSKYMLALIWEK